MTHSQQLRALFIFAGNHVGALILRAKKLHAPRVSGAWMDIDLAFHSS
jgi:hypothetical protein